MAHSAEWWEAGPRNAPGGERWRAAPGGESTFNDILGRLSRWHQMLVFRFATTPDFMWFNVVRVTNNAMFSALIFVLLCGARGALHSS
eukprot:4577579-Pleurochrysis_carterae.AAC.2